MIKRGPAHIKVSAVTTPSPKNKRKAAKAGYNDKKPSGIPIHTGSYSGKDYRQLKPFEKLEVKRLREAEGKPAARSVAAVAASPVLSASLEESEPDEVVALKQPQFGRAAHKKPAVKPSRRSSSALTIILLTAKLANKVTSSSEAEAGNSQGVGRWVVSMVYRIAAVSTSTLRCELDSHADTVVAGANTLRVSDDGREVIVHGYSEEQRQ